MESGEGGMKSEFPIRRDKSTGIYGIFNKCSGAWYIGQSIDIEKRWSQHKIDLKSNTHDNPRLQRSWNVHGQSSFEFVVVEAHDEYDETYITERELFWILKVGYPDRSKCFNLREAGAKGKLSEETKRKIGLSHVGKPGAMRGKRHTPETRLKMKQKCSTEEFKAKMSKVHKGKQFTEEHKKAISVALKHRVLSPESRLKMSISQKKRFTEGRVSKEWMDAMKGRHNSAKGEGNANAKLTEADVLKIRHDTRHYREIADAFGIAYNTVSRIKGRSLWKHVGCPECKGNRLIPIEEVDDVCPACGRRKEE